MRALLSLIALTFLLAAPARAGEEDLIKTFQTWSAFASGEGKDRICYLGGLPENSEGNYTKRGPTNLWVTHRPDEDSFDVVQIVAGYTFKPRSEVTVTIGKDTFALYTVEDSAWARDPQTDRALVRAMRAGLDMVVRGTSSRGTDTTDTYSLKGFTAAHNATRKACGIE